jgi:hypothetical protein
MRRRLFTIIVVSIICTLWFLGQALCQTRKKTVVAVQGQEASISSPTESDDEASETVKTKNPIKLILSTPKPLLFIAE